MTTVVVGCDPGLSGAIAFMDPTGVLERVEDWPIIRDRSLGWVDGGALRSLLLDALHGRPAVAIVERVGSMPKQGVASTFAFGVAFGSILSLIQSAGISIELVTPASWKAAAGLGPDKHASLFKARLLYPDAPLTRIRDHNRAEAILLARHGLARRVAA